MRNQLAILSLFLFINVSIHGQTIVPGSEVLNISQNKANAWKNAWSHKDILYDVGNNYDLKYYRFFWDIDPADHYISGNVTSYFEITANNTQTIQFELTNDLTVDSVKYHNALLSYTHISKTISIDLGTQLSTGILDSLTIWYQGIPGTGSGFGSFVTEEHNSTPVMWTLSEPYGSSDWWPCKNVLNDKADSIDVFVRTPSAYRAASNGLLVEEIGRASCRERV